MVGETGPFIGLNDYVVILGHVRNQEIESDDRNVENPRPGLGCLLQDRRHLIRDVVDRAAGAQIGGLAHGQFLTGRQNVVHLVAGGLHAALGFRIHRNSALAAGGGRRHALTSRVVAKREFAGSWEYLLDEAIFTTPVHPNWGGTGLVDRNGRLVGVGSLFIQGAGPNGADGNMVVPIDVLKPILDPLVKTGHTGRVPRPWLGLYAADNDETIVVAGMASAGPASQGGVMIGDEILQVAGSPIRGLSDFFRRVWRLGPAGVEVPLTVKREEHGLVEIMLRSANRADFLRKPRLHA